MLVMRGQLDIAGFKLPQATTTRKLSRHQASQVISGIETLIIFIIVVPFDALAKNSSRQAFQKFAKSSIRIHVAVS